MDEILTAAAPEEQAEQEEILIATVGAVTETGVTLIFAGEESASEKTYQGNVSAALKAGDRVKITKDSGTYLIDYAVGVPGSAVGEDIHELPAGGAKGLSSRKAPLTVMLNGTPFRLPAVCPQAAQTGNSLPRTELRTTPASGWTTPYLPAALTGRC